MIVYNGQNMTHALIPYRAANLYVYRISVLLLVALRKCLQHRKFLNFTGLSLECRVGVCRVACTIRIRRHQSKHLRTQQRHSGRQKPEALGPARYL